LNLKSFLGSSDGRYYGRVFTEMMDLIGKMDGNLIQVPSPRVNAEKSEPSFSKPANQGTSPSMSNSNKEKVGSEPIIIEHHLTGDKFQIALKNFPSQMNWHDAMRACNDLGSGWRLPTLSELESIDKKLFTKGKGNLETKEMAQYWSSTENEDYNYAGIFELGFNYNYNNCSFFEKHVKFYVRAVRSV
jgi:hypothetical protein